MKRTLVMIVALVASAIAAQAGGWRDRYYGNYDYDRRYLGGRYDVYRPPVVGGSYYDARSGGCSYYSPSVNHPRYVDPCVGGPEYLPPPPPVYYGAPYGGRPRFRGFDLQGPGFGLRLKLF
jgi:hypothetical protein